jgi:hypothetical protein
MQNPSEPHAHFSEPKLRKGTLRRAGTLGVQATRIVVDLMYTPTDLDAPMLPDAGEGGGEGGAAALSEVRWQTTPRAYLIVIRADTVTDIPLRFYSLHTRSPSCSGSLRCEAQGS